jgi:tRNA pseudouridine55 synthase
LAVAGGRTERAPVTARSGLVIVDKPAGWTSHDVVARIRRLAGTRRVGHAGTLDPMATGVLVVGVEKATRLLGHLTLTEKEYSATIRLGQATDTDDADGQIISASPASSVSAEALNAAVAALTGEIQQVPPGISAIKVAGQRAYRLTRDGTPPQLAARTVTVRAFAVLAVRQVGEWLDVDVLVTCSSGTYIRALARDLGAALGVGGHLTMLRRTRVGPYDLSMAHTLDELASGPNQPASDQPASDQPASDRPGAELAMVPLEDAAAAAFPSRSLTESEARSLAHGASLPWAGPAPGPVAAFSPEGTLIALVAERDGAARPLAVFVP